MIITETPRNSLYNFAGSFLFVIRSGDINHRTLCFTVTSNKTIIGIPDKDNLYVTTW